MLDYENLQAWTDEGLQRVVFDESALLECRREALRKLVRRDAPELEATARRLLDETKSANELRRSAALVLGQRLSRDAEASLVRALLSDDESIVRFSAASLGKIGDERVLAALQEVARHRSPVVQRSIDFARSLISYRLGLSDGRIPRPAADTIVKLDRQEATAVRTTNVPNNAFTDAGPNLSRELPGIEFATQGLARLECMREHLWIVLPRAIARRGVHLLSNRAAVAAVMLKLSTCSERWHVQEYILTHPADDDTIEVHGVRASGRPVHYGRAVIDADNATLTLHALNVAGIPALEMIVGYSSAAGAATIHEALTFNRRRDDQRGELLVRPDLPET